MSQQPHVPELGQMVLGQTGHGLRTSGLHTDRLRALAREVCKANPAVYQDGINWESDTEHFGTVAEQAAIEHFLHWGAGYFENDVFVLHGYTYDDYCVCGAYDKDNTMPFAAGEGVSETDIRAVLCVCEDGECEYLKPDARVPLAPNFLHKSTGVAVSWYKHVARGASISHDVTDEQWWTIIGHCADSLSGQATTAVADMTLWPVRAARRAAHTELLAWATERPDAVADAAARRAADWAHV